MHNCEKSVKRKKLLISSKEERIFCEGKNPFLERENCIKIDKTEGCSFKQVPESLRKEVWMPKMPVKKQGNRGIHLSSHKSCFESIGWMFKKSKKMENQLQGRKGIIPFVRVLCSRDDKKTFVSFLKQNKRSLSTGKRCLSLSDYGQLGFFRREKTCSTCLNHS